MNLYTGIRVLNLSEENFSDLAERKLDLGFKTNEYLIAKDENDDIKGKYRWTGSEFVTIKYPKIKGFSSKSYKQDCLCDLLLNMDVPIKIIAGVPGSGKSKICITFGLEYLLKGKYERLFIVRHNVSVGEKNGYLPGDKFAKIRGWLGYLEDNLDSSQYTIEEMVERKSMEVDNIEYLKGRDIKNSWIMADEAEDLTVEQFKMLGERVSAGSTICFIGDYEQTTQEKYKKNNGLVRAIDVLAGNPRVGIIVFDDKENDNVRSEVSKVFTYLY
jgi:predicted ribonuclease YlaK